MFRYNKKIDRWSHKMISNINNVWGMQIDKMPIRKIKTLPLLKDYLDKFLKKNHKQIFNKLNKIFKTTYSSDSFKYYLNTTSVSLYNPLERFISISPNHSFTRYPTVIIHELFHIFFYLYLTSDKFLKDNRLKSIEQLLTREELNEVKEIITIIINHEFNNLIDYPDSGYPKHSHLRKIAEKIWLRDKNFQKFITRFIQVYKKDRVIKTTKKR